jgi:hypothetical protein
MKRIIKIHKHHFKFFLIVFLFLFLFGCDGIAPTLPVINSFTANPSNIDSGDSSVLSWNVTNATNITIIPGNMTFTSPSGSVALFPTMSTNYALTATNAEGSVSSSVAINVNSAPITEETITIQPGPEGKDNYIGQLGANGDSDSLKFGSLSTYGFRTYLQFDLSILPADAIIVSADLRLYRCSNFGIQGFIIVTELHRLTESWDEHTINPLNQPDYLSSPESTTSVTIGATGWLSWDITDLLQGWMDGSVVNYGVVIKAMNEGIGSNYVICYSSDYTTDSSLRPKLLITYYSP